MHFVISVFISVCILAIVILFAEIFPKWVQYAFTVAGCLTSGYAVAILVRKIAEESGWYTKPDLLPAFYVAAPCMLVAVIIVKVLINKRSAKKVS